jgi:hypothetical protein
MTRKESNIGVPQREITSFAHIEKAFGVSDRRLKPGRKVRAGENRLHRQSFANVRRLYRTHDTARSDTGHIRVREALGRPMVISRPFLL